MSIISSFTITDISEFKKMIKNVEKIKSLFIFTITKHKLVIVGLKDDASVVIRTSMTRNMLSKFVPPKSSFSFSINGLLIMKFIECVDNKDRINFVIKENNLEMEIEKEIPDKLIFDIVSCPQPKIDDMKHETIITLQLDTFLDLISQMKHMKSDVCIHIEDDKVIITNESNKKIELKPNEIQGKKSTSCCLPKGCFSFVPNKTNSIGSVVCIYMTDDYPLLLHYEDKSKTYIILKTIA
jgi:hypothetical protein